MANKMTKKEIERMKRLYKAGNNLTQIGAKINRSWRTVKKYLNQNGIDTSSYEPKNCEKCKKPFVPTHAQQKYCHNPCKYKHREGIALIYFYIRSIRKEFYQRIKDNPAKALRLEKDMIREEGQEFRDLVLGDITASKQFQKAAETYIKYKKVWSGNE